MRKYQAIHCGSTKEPIIVEAETTYEASLKARELLKVPRKQIGLLSVVLIEQDGQEYLHDTASI